MNENKQLTIMKLKKLIQELSDGDILLISFIRMEGDEDEV